LTPQDSREEKKTTQIDEDDAAVIERLCEDGFDLALVKEAYSLCSKNEPEARLVLHEMYEAFIGSATRNPPGSLHDAVSKGDMAMLKMVLAMGGYVNEISNNCRPEQTALMCAAFKNEEEFISVLVEHGANVGIANGDGNTALHFAAEAGSIGAAKLLLEYGADIEGKNKKGLTPVGCAAPKIREFLGKLSKGKGVLKTPQVTPLSLPLPSSPARSQPPGKPPKRSDLKRPPPVPKKSAALLKKFSSPPVTTSQEASKATEATAAIIVAKVNDSKTTISTFQSTMNPKLTIRVARLPASLDQPRKSFQPKPISPPSIIIPPSTPKPKPPITDLLTAVTHGSLLQLLTFLKTSPQSLSTLDPQGNTPLHLASSTGSDTKVNILLKHRADPNITNNIGNAPLHEAAQMGHLYVVKLLLGSGAKPDLRNKHGDTPGGVAAFYGWGGVLEVLLGFGGGGREREKDELRGNAREGERLGAAGEGGGYREVFRVLGESG
jgi:ankyrin repeat protein